MYMRNPSMGPRSENRGYGRYGQWLGADAPPSMGPRSENRGYGGRVRPIEGRTVPSMGPRSENRGYVMRSLVYFPVFILQWVHGPRTVVMPCGSAYALAAGGTLQWVHGPRTVVMIGFSGRYLETVVLQWVHGPRTVVMTH